MSSLTTVQQIAVWALPILFAITLHEVAHGWVARALGDPTAASQGRLSLNPLRHVDPFGTVVLPVLLLVFGGFMFGWAKPVPVDARNFKKPRQDMALVAVAGPASNFVMALAWGVVLKFASGFGAEGGLFYGLGLMGMAGIQINLSLMVLNLLPLPPLDGGRVLVGLLPPTAAYKYAQIEPYGLVILIVLIATKVLGTLLAIPYALSINAVAALLDLH
jgi:Zn-dependent protease